MYSEVGVVARIMQVGDGVMVVWLAGDFAMVVCRPWCLPSALLSGLRLLRLAVLLEVLVVWGS